MPSPYPFEVFEHELLNPFRGHELTEIERYVAGVLLDATSAKPIGIAELIPQVEMALEQQMSEREIKKVIRRLRKEHAFPILSRRRKPAGYWWCSSADEMEEWIVLFRSQALDELETISKIVMANYPALAGQLRLEVVS
jgi:hypothetical protein